MDEALNIVYAAKRAAEVAPGVGCETDLALITDGNVIEIDQEIIHELSEIYNTVHKTPVDEIAEKSERLRLLMEKRIESQKDVDYSVDTNINNEDEQLKEDDKNE